MPRPAQHLHNQILAAHPNAVLHSRHLHAVHYQNPDGRMVAAFSPAPVHYLDGGNWNEIDTDWTDADPTSGFVYALTSNNHRVFLAADGSRTIFPFRDRQDVYLTIHPLEYQQGNRWRAFVWDQGRFKASNVAKWVNADYDYETQAGSTLVKTNLIVKRSLPAIPVRWRLTLNGLTLNGDTLTDSLTGEFALRFDPIVAVDANGVERTFTRTLTNTEMSLTPDFTGLTFPVAIDPTTNFVSESSDGYVQGTSTAYATARDVSTSLSSGTEVMFVGQQYAVPNYTCYQGFVRWNTSSIPDTDTIDSATLQITTGRMAAVTDFIIYAGVFAWGPTLELTDYRTGTLLNNINHVAELDTTPLADSSTYNFTEVSTSLRAAVNKTGYTEMVFWSSRQEGAGIAPTGQEYVVINPSEHTTMAEPLLIVTYSAGSVPVVYNETTTVANEVLVTSSGSDAALLVDMQTVVSPVQVVTAGDAAHLIAELTNNLSLVPVVTDGFDLYEPVVTEPQTYIETGNPQIILVQTQSSVETQTFRYTELTGSSLIGAVSGGVDTHTASELTGLTLVRAVSISTLEHQTFLYRELEGSSLVGVVSGGTDGFSIIDFANATIVHVITDGYDTIPGPELGGLSEVLVVTEGFDSFIIGHAEVYLPVNFQAMHPYVASVFESVNEYQSSSFLSTNPFSESTFRITKQ